MDEIKTFTEQNKDAVKFSEEQRAERTSARQLYAELQLQADDLILEKMKLLAEASGQKYEMLNPVELVELRLKAIETLIDENKLDSEGRLVQE